MVADEDVEDLDQLLTFDHDPLEKRCKVDVRKMFFPAGVLCTYPYTVAVPLAEMVSEVLAWLI